MRIRSFIFLFFFIAFINAQAQIAAGFSSSHDIYYNKLSAFRSKYGIGFQYFVGKHISLNNRILFGVNPRNNKVMVHYGLGGLLTQATLSGNGGLFFTGNVVNELLALVLLPIIVPEGVQFHIGKGNFQFSPYIYPASFQYNTFGDQEVKALLELGVSTRFRTKDGLLIAPNLGWKMRYGDNLQAISVGVMIGYQSKD
jgi:hypothetical protein